MAYFIKRLLLFIPTLFIISLIIFGISSAGDYNIIQLIEESSTRAEKFDFITMDEKARSILSSESKDKPLFYLSTYRKSLSDTINLISIKDINASMHFWSYQLGSWLMTNELYKKIKMELRNTDDPKISNQLAELLYEKDVLIVIKKLSKINIDFQADDYKVAATKSFHFNNFIPIVKWNGTNNQYHNWLRSILSFDFGKSRISKQDISFKIGNAIQYTLALSLIALSVSLIIAVPLAVYAAADPDGTLDKICSNLFFTLYSIPVFWLGSILLMYFASIENFHWFPSFGVGELNESMTFLEKVQIRVSHMFLPVVCWTYGSLAFIYRQMRNKMIETFNQDYILTAKAKGLNTKSIVWKHAFNNSSFPLITYLGASLPALIGGSFVIESIFAIPGMGKLTIEAFLQRDLPMINTICLLACFLTILGIFIADLAYHYADPRIKYKNTNG